MRRIRGNALALVVAQIAVGAIVLPGAAAAVARTAPARTPVLHLVSQRPRLAVHGSGFRAREAVELAVIGASVVTGRASAAADGSFDLSLARPAPLGCGRLLLRATGARGSRAFLRLGPAECNPAGADAAAGNR